jgi:UDP-N-acetylglucosamine 1-carboxyvinyltransferase
LDDVLALENGVPAAAQQPRAAEADSLEVAGLASLEGHVPISGAKNSALAVMAGAVLCDGEVLLRRIPGLTDIESMSAVMRSVGCRVGPGSDANTLVVDARVLTSCEPSEQSVKRLRASFFMVGSLLARMGEARVPLPGGCNIGLRPVDLHIRGMEALGAKVSIEHGRVNAVAPAGGLRGAKIYLDYPSVGATETILMAAVGATGETVIANVAQEPEVVDLANFLNAMGARIEGAGTNSIHVTGTGLGGLRNPAEFSIIPDRIEAGTFLVAGAITGSSLSLAPVVPAHLTAAIAKLQEMGCQVIIEGPERVRIVPTAALKPADITTLPYPGFPTDLQSQFTSLLAHAHGTSVVRETVFEKRMGTVGELQRMGANIKLIGCDTAVVEGGWVSGTPLLQGTHVSASDLRSGAALVLAGLAAEGVTTVHGLKHMDRGYCDFEAKLSAIGADVRRISTGDGQW